MVPVLNRPHRARPLVESIAKATRRDHAVLFVCSPDDDAEIDACSELSTLRSNVYVMTMASPPERGDYARKVNAALPVALDLGCAWLFTGADDLAFHPGWDEIALRHDGYGDVLGTVDLCNRRTRNAQHSTHSLVRVSYAAAHGTIDRPRSVLHEGYWHNYVDDELLATARHRNVYVPTRAVVEHQHFTNRRSRVTLDDTYRKGQEHFADDRALFHERSHLWQ